MNDAPRTTAPVAKDAKGFKQSAQTVQKITERIDQQLLNAVSNYDEAIKDLTEDRQFLMELQQEVADAIFTVEETLEVLTAAERSSSILKARVLDRHAEVKPPIVPFESSRDLGELAYDASEDTPITRAESAIRDVVKQQHRTHPSSTDRGGDGGSD